MAAQDANRGRNTNPWLVAFIVSLATFMEVMDTSIANVALRHIAGSVGADQSESTWVLTSYLVSNAIVVPISGWLASVVGRKRFYMLCVAVFTASSLACGLCFSLGLLLTCRVLQGIGGGGLAPSEQAILADTFPPEKRGMAFAAYGVAVVVAPAVGPALGGWITDTYSWRWIFFINIPVGITSLLMTYFLVPESASAKQEHAKATGSGIKVDYIGFALVAIGLGSLQVVLDKGQEDDWFGSGLITTFASLSALGIIGGILWELFGTKNPIVDLPLLRNRSFLFTNVMMFVTLFILQSTTQILPQFVQQVLPYDATHAGLILMPGGFVLMALMPLVGFLVKTVQPKYLIGAGFLLMAGSMNHLSGIEPGESFHALAVARIFQAAGFAFLFVPIQTLAYSNLPKDKSSNASALINLMRNLGGSVGISMATTLLARRSQVHQDRLVSTFTPTSLPTHAYLQSLAERFQSLGVDSVTGMRKAVVAVSQTIATQAVVLSYLDIFVVLMYGCLLAASLTLFLRKIDLGKASSH
jgi:DHA2 family multidrug resistance protein